jgi:SAM-dependent methyltransferase
MNTHPLICPVCGNDFREEPGRIVCDLGHSFDVAREGYVNLLRPGSPRAKIPGDTGPMLRARRSFLDRGHYRPLAGLIAARLDEFLADVPGDDRYVAEVGSGEGYYLGFVKRYLEERGKTGLGFLGMDRSRDAARLASKRYRDITFLVGDVWEKVLFRDGSISVLLDIFAPRNPDEFARVLAPGGLLLLAIPGEAHLGELRSELPLMGMEADKEEQAVRRLSGAFRPARREALRYTVQLEGDELHDLVGMTPNFWHIPEQDRERLRNRSMRVTADFVVLEFTKTMDKVQLTMDNEKKEY